MTTNLFEDFDPISSSNGNKKIQFELKDGLQEYLNLEFSRRY
jgi:hypothetical protein